MHFLKESVHRIKRHVPLSCVIAGKVNGNHLVKMAATEYLYCKDTIAFYFLMSKYLLGRYSKAINTLFLLELSLVNLHPPVTFDQFNDY